ncbi:hypothetical protein GCM10010971_25680 [Silvimonas amylolytica]|uniref:Uncharacterized protein n=1 Tax=Silvimonas amylolytica TaxID=449663 RepID=A0ABQ2PMA6_9NEIS|nr:hypothetical protein GCM10010971_25680 [Silvimonas amylolytica]
MSAASGLGLRERDEEGRCNGKAVGHPPDKKKAPLKRGLAHHEGQ